MGEMIKLTDASAHDHYVTWANIVDAYFTGERDNAIVYVITTANTIQPSTLGTAHQIILTGAAAEEFRTLLEERIARSPA